MSFTRRPGVGAARRGGFRGIGGGAAEPQPPTTNLLDWYSPESYDTVTPSWPSGGSLARTLSVVTNPPLAGISINDETTRDLTGLRWLRNGTGSRSQPFSVYAVVRTGLVASTQLFFDGSGAANRITGSIAATGILRGNAGTNLSSAANTLREDTVYAIRWDFDTTSSNLYVTNLDASPVAGPGTVNTGTMAGIALGAIGSNGSSAFAGDFAELLLYDDTHDAAAVEAYISAKYPSIAKAAWTAWDMMMCGDSLTVGQGSTDSRGCRPAIRLDFEPLADDIENGVRTLRFVGATRDRCMSHYGVSGRRIAELRDNIAAQLTTYTPDFVPILIGTNDCRENGTTYDPVTTPAAYGDMLTNAYTALPGAKYACFTVPPLTNGTHDANVDDLNSKLPGLIATASGGGMDVTLYDLNAVINSGTDLDADGVHLNDAGYAKMATLYATAIRAAA